MMSFRYPELKNIIAIKKVKIESLFRLIFKKLNLNILTFPCQKLFSGQVSTIAFRAFSETSSSVTEDTLWAASGF
ncbi:hypothetical protein EO92_13875 [Methanosarcina sp. 2.H.A.1B.4]|nr:hypothetical protein EO92_13875 [Methanosarcina sp. 2.H.A.1B.4]